ncbi:MAG: hypothetical protein M3M98_01830 [Nitrospirota bacterium]|nr:hypothetical protein [Nitrospirota bacterium]
MEGDETLYADLPELVPTFDRPPHHQYLGPVLWSPAETPLWWDSVPRARPLAYVSLGTSGRPEILSSVLWALNSLGIGALVSTAGRSTPANLPDHTWIAPYLPGISAAGRADLVVCNGGSATVYQAFAAGAPVLGIPSNLDQYLMMEYVQRYEAGESLRAGEASMPALTRITKRMVQSSRYRLRAGRLGALIASGQPAERLDHLLRQMLGTEPDEAFGASILQSGASSPHRGSRSEGAHSVNRPPSSRLTLNRKGSSQDATT